MLDKNVLREKRRNYKNENIGEISKKLEAFDTVNEEYEDGFWTIDTSSFLTLICC